MKIAPSYAFKLMVVLAFAVPFEAVTVNPNLCPTNKIAPHRRSAEWVNESPRTFGAFYDLLLPNQFIPPSSLQEEPQKDEFEDCGDIGDYDENDLSSLTSQSQRRHGYDDGGRYFFGGLFNEPHNVQYPGRPMPVRPNRPNYPPRPTAVPPNRPNYPPVRPPYWSGGYFGNNPYRPPTQQHPSDNVKPVHEDSYHEPEMTYRPDVVGGPSGHVVGVRPTRRPSIASSSHEAPSHIRFPIPTQATVYTTKRPRPRKLNNEGLFGSFIDLLFK